MTEYESFWKRTNALIKQKNLTQKELDKSCCFSDRRIENLSTAKRSPDVIEVVKIAKALNTSVEYLVTGEQDDSVVTKLSTIKNLAQNIVDII